ncbi:hypothetical protein GSI_09879 [Ganoderma sinense ZZ0214-1]|uniref:Uncharacterized protein n=1 Tax=Ganoderma sinense ZZ0214-1 TaxID=1077348 RepID=A0A2G8S3A4_9APHY|nr:hypothetical protein GSI_09879 [Ganoderma sinense ZZ0214-1]
MRMNLTSRTKNSGSWMMLYSDPVDAKTLSFWTRELGNHLPMLLDHGGAVTAQCSEALNPSAAPHHDSVQALVVSPDSKRVASGSLDPTVVLWDAVSRTVFRRWVPHAYKPVRSLAFSPDSLFLVSGGDDDGKAVIWDLTCSQSMCKIATLEGHSGHVLTCAWSLDGGTIATGSENETVWLWDARTPTYRERALVRLKGAMVRLAFSQDGSWLACGSNRSECCIVNVASGCLSRSLWNSPSHSQDAENDNFEDTYSGGSHTPHQMRDERKHTPRRRPVWLLLRD